MGMLLSLGILWVATEILHRSKNYEQKSMLSVIGVLILQIITTVLIGWGLSWEAQQFILGLLIIPMVALYARSPHIRSQI